jgi:hypothetical protein
LFEAINTTKISGNWTPHFKFAYSDNKWTTKSSRFKLAELLKCEENGERDMLVWLLNVFTGERQPEEIEHYIERPVKGLITSDTTFFMVWRNVLLKYKLTDESLASIAEKMVYFALNRYQKDGGDKVSDQQLSNAEKHSVIPTFVKSYMDIFIVWTKQLLLNNQERAQYVATLQNDD